MRGNVGDSSIRLQGVHDLRSRFRRDSTSVVDVTGLMPNNRYHYAAIRESLLRKGESTEITGTAWELGQLQELSFRT